MENLNFNRRFIVSILILFVFVCGIVSTASATKAILIDKGSASCQMGSYNIHKTWTAYKTGNNYVKVTTTEKTTSGYGVTKSSVFLILKKVSATKLKISYSTGSGTQVRYVKTKLTAVQYFWKKTNELRKKGSKDCYWNIHQ